MRKFLVFVLWFLLWSASAAYAQEYVVSTIAGGVPLIGVAATDVSIGSPGSIAVDGLGNVYFSSNSSAYKVSVNGVLTRVAGSRGSGYSGDGGPAIHALLNFPRLSPNYSLDFGDIFAGIAVDAAGNLYIADMFNDRVRKVGLDGVITTIAGGGKWSGPAAVGRPATDAGLLWPQHVAVDSGGNLYIGHAYRDHYKVTPEGIVTSVNLQRCEYNYSTGTTTGVCGDDSRAIDGFGNLYIVESGRCRIHKVSPDGTTTDVAGAWGLSRNGNSLPCGYSGDGGPGTSAMLWSPRGIAVDSKGVLYIADTGNNCIRAVTSDGIINSVAGICQGPAAFAGDGGPATSAQLNRPVAVAVDSNSNLYIADAGNNRIRKVGADGVILTIAGNGFFSSSADGGPAALTQVDLMDGISRLAGDVTVDYNGSVYFSEPANHRVRKIGPDGIVTTFAGTGIAGYQGDGKEAIHARLFGPTRVAPGAFGDLYITDTLNGRIRQVTPDGIISTQDTYARTIIKLLAFPYGGAFSAAGDIYFAECCSILKMTSGGIISKIADIQRDPPYVTYGSMDAYQPFACDVPGLRIGTNGPCGMVRAVTVDQIGNVYFHNNANVFKLSTDSVLTTIAGNGSYGYSGDGGPASEAQFMFISGLAVDLYGRIYVADAGNNAIRLLQPRSLAEERMN